MVSASITQLDLLVLGFLQDRPMHGYELNQQIKAAGLELWFDYSLAGLYYSLGKLRDLGLVTDSRQRRTGGAEKAIFHVTEAGRQGFQSALQDLIAAPREAHFEYDLGIFLLNRLPLSRAEELLAQRLDFLQRWGEKIGHEWQRAKEQGLSPNQLAILDHSQRFIRMELEWLRDLIDDIHPTDALASEHTAGNLMVLSGSLRQYHLPDLIRLIASGQHSGRLTLHDNPLLRTITFESGQPRCLSASRREGTDDEPADEQDMLAAIGDVFRWQEGDFYFDQTPRQHTSCLPCPWNATELILAGCRWVDNWELIQRLVPSSDSVFEWVTSQAVAEDLALSDQERRVLDALDGATDIATLARDQGMTIFEASRTIYGLVAADLIRTADLDRIRIRRVFREIAELMCRSTLAWRSSPDDRTCEQEVNARCTTLPLRLVEGRIADQTDPHLPTDGLARLYLSFLQTQIEVVTQRFGRDNARQSYWRTLQQLVPELQEVAHRFGFDHLID